MARHCAQVFVALFVVGFISCSPTPTPGNIESSSASSDVVSQDVGPMPAAAKMEERFSHTVLRKEEVTNPEAMEYSSDRAQPEPKQETIAAAVVHQEDRSHYNASEVNDSTTVDGPLRSKETCKEEGDQDLRHPSQRSGNPVEVAARQQSPVIDAALEPSVTTTNSEEAGQSLESENESESKLNDRKATDMQTHHLDITSKSTHSKVESSSSGLVTYRTNDKGVVHVVVNSATKIAQGIGHYICMAIEKSTGNRNKCTLSPERLEAANRAITAVSDTTKALLKHTPRVFDQSRQYLDQAAQHAVEKALEIAVLGGNAFEIATTVGLQIALATQKQVVSVIRSPQGQAVQIWAYKTTQNMIDLTKEAVKVSVNRALWRIADSSAWLASPSRREYPMGLFFIYQETNNIHALIPVFTKKHEYLGTFLDDSTGETHGLVVVSGATKCADECWKMTAKAIEGCQGFDFMGSGLQDHHSRATCAICRSFVWYAMDHDNLRLRGKCFAVTALAWAPAYETGVVSGYFQIRDDAIADSGTAVKEEANSVNLISSSTTPADASDEDGDLVERISMEESKTSASMSSDTLDAKAGPSPYSSNGE